MGAERRELGEHVAAEAPSVEGDALASALIERIVEATSERSKDAGAPSPPRDRLSAFLRSARAGEALELWLGKGWGDRVEDAEQLSRLLSSHISDIDDLIAGQVNEILHHPRFQRVEASWRGLRFLVEDANHEEGVVIRMLNVSLRDLARDFRRATEFDQSQLFRKIYSEEFDMPGGTPFGVLIGDYEFHHRHIAGERMTGVEILEHLSQVSAAAFAPFIGGAHPRLFGMRQFGDLGLPANLPRIFESPEYVQWKAFRRSEDARFVGLALPRVLLRLPYEDDGSRDDGFRFREEVEGPDASKYLWGNAAWAFGSVLVRCFGETGWLADIRGVTRGKETGGLVAGLPCHSFGTDVEGTALKSQTDFIVTDAKERELGELGFIPLCHCKDTEFSAFYGNQSAQEPQTYSEEAATINAKMSSMLQYILCASRFAHYLKVRSRSKIGVFSEPQKLQNELNDWLHEYVTADSFASPAAKAEYPLRAAEVQISETQVPGSYATIMYLEPHMQFDAVTAKVTLRMQLRNEEEAR